MNYSTMSKEEGADFEEWKQAIKTLAEAENLEVPGDEELRPIFESNQSVNGALGLIRAMK